MQQGDGHLPWQMQQPQSMHDPLLNNDAIPGFVMRLFLPFAGASMGSGSSLIPPPSLPLPFIVCCWGGPRLNWWYAKTSAGVILSSAPGSEFLMRTTKLLQSSSNSLARLSFCASTIADGRICACPECVLEVLVPGMLTMRAQTI